MFWNEHAPPHFHALYGEHEALIDMRDLRVTRGMLPRRALALVLEWARTTVTNSWRIGTYADDCNPRSQSSP